MTSSSNHESRLEIMEKIAKTLSEFMETPNNPDDEQEKKLALEDVSEFIVNTLGIDVSTQLEDDGSMTAVITSYVPEDYDIRDFI